MGDQEHHLGYITVDGMVVHPRTIVAENGARSGEHACELCIPTGVLIHELQQAGVAVDEASLSRFLVSDISHPEAAAAYLSIATGILDPVPRPSFLSRLFGRPKTAVASATWRLCTIDGVDVQSGYVRLKGIATPARDRTDA